MVSQTTARHDASALSEARAFTRRLAARRPENFLVGTLFLPRALRQPFYDLYAFCRIADDLADESGSPEAALAALADWREQLLACFAGEPPRHPAFVALADTARRFDLPAAPFLDLLSAFEQDQTVDRYATYAELLDYCRRSADPVGRLVLMLCGYRDPERQRLSDSTCTALQLANFWQDVVPDFFERGRVYLPQEDLARFSVEETQIAERRCTPAFAALIRFEVERAEALFAGGLPLAGLVDRRLRLDIEMFSRGGMELLRRIRAQGYDVLSRRPTVPKSRQLALLAGRLLRRVA